jgi:diguanylate cyclase (GGDEF)-like protein
MPWLPHPCVPYHPAVTSERPQPRFSLLDAARVLARGRDLDAQLTALTDHARALAGAMEAAILLYDPEMDALTTARGITALAGIGDVEALGGAVRDRLPIWSAVTPAGLSGAGLLGAANRVAMVPLVMEDERGVAVEGVLIVATDEAGPDQERQDALLALADLAAVAVRQARLHSALTERADYLERLAHTDGLTGLADRRTFEQMLELELARATRQGSALALAIFDVDGLTGINDRHGARTGDDVLRRVAATLADRVRLVDTVARIGDDEFGVIAPGDPLGIVARRVRDAVVGMEPLGPVRISVSAGVAHHPTDGTTAADLLTAAHAAIDRARLQGPGSVVGEREPAT